MAERRSNDADVIGLALSDIDSGTSASGTTTYTASAANRVRETTVTPTPNHSGASFVVKLGGVEDAAGVASLSVGLNVITAEVTAEDGQTTETCSETVTRAGNTPATGTPTISGTAEVPVEPPKAASRVSMWRMVSPPEGRKSLVEHRDDAGGGDAQQQGNDAVQPIFITPSMPFSPDIGRSNGSAAFSVTESSEMPGGGFPSGSSALSYFAEGSSDA